MNKQMHRNLTTQIPTKPTDPVSRAGIWALAIGCCMIFGATLAVATRAVLA